MRYVALSILLAFITGCSSLLTSNEDVHAFYVLNPVEEVIMVRDSAPIRLGVQRPAISEWLDTQRIILRRARNEVDYYAGSRWVMPVGDMIGMVTTESLQNNKVADDVYYGAAETLADYMLILEVVALDANYESNNENPLIEVTLNGKLLAMPDSNLHYSFTTTHRIQAKRNEMSDIIKAFDAAVKECMKDVVIHTARGLAVKYEPL